MLSDSVDGSSFINPNHKQEDGVRCEVREFFSVLSDLKVDHIDLMKINIEGGEFPLLQYIADRDKLTVVDEYLIQFHDFVERAMIKRENIIKALAKSHKRTWCYTFVWENWKCK